MISFMISVVPPKWTGYGLPHRHGRIDAGGSTGACFTGGYGQDVAGAIDEGAGPVWRSSPVSQRVADRDRDLVSDRADEVPVRWSVVSFGPVGQFRQG